MMISFLGLIKVVSEFSFGYYRVVFSTASSALVGGAAVGDIYIVVVVHIQK